MPSILVVDDDQIVPLLLEAKLTGTGVDIVSCYSAKEALQLVCSNQKPELILLDVNMPQVGGLDLLETLKRNPESQHIPVVIFSSSRDPEKVERATKLGAEHFIQKPIDSEDLFQKVLPILYPNGM